jgi:D-alanyl-D-alanine carboxypeptidase/D-alanyl-D-alanine-endopeptidase (penicillin-binding protein 4)
VHRLPLTALAVAVVVAAALAGSAASSTTTSSDLRTALGRSLVAQGIDPGQTAALVVDVRTGELVFEANAGAPLRPASAEKLPLALAALRLLGPAYRFRTDLVGVGVRRGQVWDGNVFLVGGGDPTLARSDLDALAREIRARGIRRIAGRVLGDESRFDTRRDAPGWKPWFAGIESRPLSALSVEGARLRTLDGSAAATARALTAALERRGVDVVGRAGAGTARGGATPLASDLSEPLADVVRHMNRESDNFYAELLLKELGRVYGGTGSSAAGSRVVRGELADAGVPVRALRLADGSGLSSSDRLTVGALVAVLQAGASDPRIDDAFVTSLAVAGVSGTMKDRLARRPTRGQVIAKTGTTNAASALAGFVRRRYAFAILQNGAPVPYWTARSAQDRFVTVLARAK